MEGQSVSVYCFINKSLNQGIELHSMDPSHSLHSLLPAVSPDAIGFFQREGIAQLIISNIQQFVNYCNWHPAFSHQMITLALNTPAPLLLSPPAKAIYAVTEVLCSEETAIAELFFEENREEIPEEAALEKGNQFQGEGELKRHELVTASLQILEKPQANETCLGYLQKIFAFLIRHNSQPVLDYFQSHPNELDLLLSNLRYSSVSSLVAQLLTCEDRTKAYRHEKLKRRIIEFVVDELFERMDDWDCFDGMMILVEEIFNNTKQSYYDNCEDFKLAANRLVDHQTMQRFLDIILERQEPSFRSASVFLELLVARINSEAEDNSYYRREAEPSMSFQVEVFFDNLPALIELVAHIDNFKSLTKISYLSFLEGLLKCGKARKLSFALCQPAFIELLGSLNRQPTGGVYKNKLYNFISAIVHNASSAETTQFLQQHSCLWEKYFASIKDANYCDTKVYNRNESSAFDVALINHLAKKDAKAINMASQVIGKDFNVICQKYETKIATQSNVDEDSFKFDSAKLYKLPDPLQITNKKTVAQLPEVATNPFQQLANNEEFTSLNNLEEIEQMEDVIVLTDAVALKPPYEDSSELNGNKHSSEPEYHNGDRKQSQLGEKDKKGKHSGWTNFLTKHLSIFG